MLKVSLKNFLESFMLMALNVLKVAIRGTENRFLHLSPPFFRRQLVLDVPRKSIISFEIQSWYDWKTAYQVFGTDSYNLKSIGIEDQVAKLYERNTQEDTPIILDLGGNIGISSLYFSREYPQSQIYCVEIQASNVSLAISNLANHPNVKVIHAGVASKKGQGYVIDPNLGNDGFRLSLDSHGAVEAVQLIDVASLIQDQKQRGIFIAKIDIEGSEAELFSANTSWIDNTELMIFEPHDWLIPGQSSSKNFLLSISGKSRDFLIKGENIFSLSNKYF